MVGTSDAPDLSALGDGRASHQMSYASPCNPRMLIIKVLLSPQGAGRRAGHLCSCLCYLEGQPSHVNDGTAQDSEMDTVIFDLGADASRYTPEQGQRNLVCGSGVRVGGRVRPDSLLNLWWGRLWCIPAAGVWGGVGRGEAVSLWYPGFMERHVHST